MRPPGIGALAIAVLIGAAHPGAVMAQACLGFPKQAQTATTLSFAGEPDAASVGAEVTVHLAGPVLAQARLGRTELDSGETVYTPGVGLAVQFPSTARSVCALAGYTDGHPPYGSGPARADARARSRSLAAGIGVGSTLWHSHDLGVTPFLHALIVHVESGGGRALNAREAAFTAGASAVYGSLLGSASVTTSSIDDASPVLTVSVSVAR